MPYIVWHSPYFIPPSLQPHGDILVGQTRPRPPNPGDYGIISYDMNKRHLHHLWTKFRRVKPWYFLVLAVVSAVICIFALRANNQQMIKLREAVYAADQSNGDVEAALKKLQAYVTSHMNTNLDAGGNAVYPPIQLKYTYERLTQGQKEQFAQANAQLYTAAQAACEQQNSTDVSGRNRIPCIEQYVQAHNPKQLAPVPDALYKFAFATPAWSPDLAGWSMVVAILSVILTVLSFIVHRWFHKHV